MKTCLPAFGVLLVTCVLAGAAEPELVYADSLKGKLGEGWTWLREDAKGWRNSPQGLEIHVQPGGKDTVKNALLRPAPDRSHGTYALEVTVEYLSPPTVKYEQGGLTWYQSDKPVGKLVHEFIDGKAYAVTNWPPNKLGKELAENPLIRLRLVVTKDRYSTQYHPGGTGDFRPLAEGRLALSADEKISIQCYNGPTNAKHWMRFSDFKIQKLPD
jgi:hypothetical protein